jgi:hypothetical protein
MTQCMAGGCACGGKRSRTRTRKAGKKARRGGSLVGDAILAGSVVGLYSYFTKKRGGSKKMPTRKSRKHLQ